MSACLHTLRPPRLAACALALFAAVTAPLAPAAAEMREIHLQSRFPPLFFTDAPPGGAHPIGGLAYRFVEIANRSLEHLGTRIVFHASGPVPPSDAGRIQPPLVALPDDFETIYAATAAGTAGGGIDIAVGISNQNGLSFGELHVAGLPFGMEPDEFAAYLYGGGGLALQQALYDRHFEGRLMVMPIALTTTQGGGWYPEPLPDPDGDPNLSDEAAMAALCRKPWIVRWPEPGAGIWQAACQAVGAPAGFIGAKTRCADPRQPCPADDNPTAVTVDRLTFGGFVPGVPPHTFLLNGNIDAYELNMPFTEVQMIKMVLGQSDRANAAAELEPVVSRAAYYYGQTWHQPMTYVELLINRDFWNGLSEAERRLIETAAWRATLENWVATLSLQGQGIALLEANGAKVLRWPEGLLKVLRDAADDYLDRRADALAAEGDGDYRRVLDHMRAYMRAQAAYSDFGDLNQGRALLPTSPRRD